MIFPESCQLISLLELSYVSGKWLLLTHTVGCALPTVPRGQSLMNVWDMLKRGTFQREIKWREALIDAKIVTVVPHSAEVSAAIYVSFFHLTTHFTLQNRKPCLFYDDSWGKEITCIQWFLLNNKEHVHLFLSVFVCNLTPEHEMFHKVFDNPVSWNKCSIFFTIF